MKILITDGHLKATLSAVRSLGRRSLEVHTTQDRPGITLCSLSAFNQKSHILPQYEEEERFDVQFLELLTREKYDYLLPASEGALKRVSLNRDSIGRLTRVDLPPQASVDLVLSKVGLLDFAKKIQIPIPDTVFFYKSDPIVKILDTLSFPIVAKVGGMRGAYNRVRYISNVEELKSCLSSFDSDEAIIFQEYINGVGYGVFSLFEGGKSLLCQAHQRIWEYPITGGPSVFAQTVDEPVAKELGTRLLEHLNWNGLAMVEFKKSWIDNQYKLMEVNPRLWGSLDLSIAAGANFPYLVMRADRSDLAKSVTSKKTSFLWIFPDAILFLLARPSKFFHFWRVVFSPSVKKNIYLDDLKPIFFQIKEVLYWIKKLLPKARLKYPHGKPRKEGAFAFDLHIHSSFSHDSFSSIRKILEKAARLKLSAIAITDHESLEGGKRARALNQNRNLAVIVGSEIRTEIGDIIGLFIEREIKSRSAREVIKEIKTQGGLVMLPHPFSYGVTEYEESILGELDLIEIRNSRNLKEQVDRVRQYAEKYNIALAGNSDAHFIAEIGSTRNIGMQPHPALNSVEDLKRFIRSGNFCIAPAKTMPHRYPLSQAIKAFKQRRYKELLFCCWWSFKSLIKDILYVQEV